MTPKNIIPCIKVVLVSFIAVLESLAHVLTNDYQDYSKMRFDVTIQYSGKVAEVFIDGESKRRVED